MDAFGAKITKRQFSEILRIMDPEKRDKVHKRIKRHGHKLPAEEFLSLYLDYDPNFAGYLTAEYDMDV